MQNTGLGTSFRGDIDALAECRHQRIEEALVLRFVVFFAKQWLDGLSCFLGLVEWNAAEEMVDDVVVNDLVEEMTTNKTDCAVNSGERTLGVGPGLGCVVWDFRVSVLKVRDSDWADVR